MYRSKRWSKEKLQGKRENSLASLAIFFCSFNHLPAGNFPSNNTSKNQLLGHTLTRAMSSLNSLVCNCSAYWKLWSNSNRMKAIPARKNYRIKGPVSKHLLTTCNTGKILRPSVSKWQIYLYVAVTVKMKKFFIISRWIYFQPHSSSQPGFVTRIFSFRSLILARHHCVLTLIRRLLFWII